MARDVSIAISARDNFSQAIATMRNANQSFNKDLTGLSQKLDSLNKTKITIKVDADKARKELREAEKQFALTGDAADKMKLELANANYENARRNLSLVSDNAKQAEKDIRNLTDAVSKADNRASKTGSSSSVSSSTSSNDLISSLAASGVTSLIGNVVSDAATTFINSAYGSEAGTITSSMLSSGAMGAAIGSAIAPGIGTALGALGGSLLGYVQGQMAIYENKDEAYKSYYGGLYTDTLSTQSEALTSGTSIAATRETNKISFSTLLGGDDKADEFLSSVTDFASVTPFAYDDLTNISKVLLAYGYQQDEILPLLEKVGDAGSALGMSTEDMKYVATALGRMQTTGKTTLEYLNPLLERGIDVWSYLADASGKTKKEVQDMVSKGLVPGEEAAKAIADYMGYEYSGNMEKQAQTYTGLVSTLEDNQAALENAMGEGYTSTRKTGLQDQIDWLSGDSGAAMEEAYNQIGQWKASLENLQEQYQRDAMNSVMTGTIADSYSTSSQKSALERLASEYQTAQREYNANIELGDTESAEKAGAEMGRILAEAQAIATNEYNASDGAQLALESNETLAENIKNDSAGQDAYWDAGYSLGQQFTKGLASAITDASISYDQLTQKNTMSVSEVWGVLSGENQSSLTGQSGTGAGRQTSNSESGSSEGQFYPGNSRAHAYGLGYVPYDNYPALLHEGERVLTASENRNRSSANNIPVTITGNNFVVRSEDDIEEIGKAVASEINRAFQLA